MPIRPIDIITIAPKSQEATQYKHAEIQKPVQEQNYLNQSFQHNVQHNMQKTVAPTKNDATNFTYDAKEKGNNEYFGQKKKKSKDKEPDDTKPQKKSGGIDIRI